MIELFLFLVFILFCAEKAYKPRIDITEYSDVVLWINRKGHREPIILFNIKL